MDTKLNPAEPLWPQVLRSALVGVGGYVTATGVVDANEWTALSGAFVMVVPILYRVATTLLARRAAG